MCQSRMKYTFNLDPDGVTIVVAWGDFVVGSSFFVPCINTSKARRQVKAIAKKLGMGVKTETRIEGGKWGLRVWRTT